MLCLVMRVCNFLLLFCTDMFFVTTMTPRYSRSPFLYQRQPAFIFTCVHNRHIPPRYVVTTQMTHSVSTSMTHAAHQFSRSHNAPIPTCFSKHKPTLLFTCIRHRHNPRMYSVTTQMTQSVSYSFILLLSGLYFIIISHTHIMIHTT